MYGSLILHTVRLYEHPFPQLVRIIEVPLYMRNGIASEAQDRGM